jgi:hypothetical protein
VARLTPDDQRARKAGPFTSTLGVTRVLVHPGLTPAGGQASSKMMKRHGTSLPYPHRARRPQQGFDLGGEELAASRPPMVAVLRMRASGIGMVGVAPSFASLGCA